MKKILKKGDKGDDVKELQSLLGCTVDGIFGNETEEYVKQFQQINNIAVDGIVGKNTWFILTTNSLHIIPMYINNNLTKSINRSIKYIVIHYTAGSSSKQGSAKNNRNVFLTTKSSADFIVDDIDIIQVNPNPRDYYCWAVGDGKGRNGIYNKDCISIEICSNRNKNTTYKVPNHSGWYFTNSSLQNATKLCKYLMYKYNISVENVIRHYDVSGKLCPGIIGWNDGIIYDTTGRPTNKRNNEELWINFKKSIS